MRLKSTLCMLTLLTASSTSYALTRAQSESISGNPIERHDNYTINSQRQANVTLTCTFTNKAQVPATLNIWTSPHQKRPVRVVKLKPAENNKPVSDTQTLHLDLNPVWWCAIYLKSHQRDWKFCHYLSISDATISEYRPFGTWNKTIRSKKTHFNCTITQARPKDTQVRFFYFK